MRKALTAIAVIVALCAVLAVVAWWRAGRVQVESVTRDVWMLTGLGGNVGVLRTDGGAVVVDTMTFPRLGARILAQAEALTGQPVSAILNTHYHFDHTHGNPAFPPGTKVVATQRTLEHLRERDSDFWREPPARDLLPNETFDDGAHELRVGGKTVRAFHTGRGHTDGDLVVLFVEDRVLHAGDLFFEGHYPNIDLEAGGSVREWPAAVQRILDLDVEFDAVIPGHGPLSSRQGLRRFAEFMASLWEQTSAVAGRGGSLDDALREVDLERFHMTPMWFAPSLNRDFVVRRAYDEATRDVGGRSG